MNDNLGFSVTTRLGNAVDRLGGLMRSMLGVEAATEKVNKKAAPAGKTLSSLGQAATLAGGPLAALGQQLTGSAGLIGGLGKVGIVIGLVTGALALFRARAELAAQAMRRNIQLAREMAAANTRAAAATQASGQGAAGQVPLVRRLAAEGLSEEEARKFAVGQNVPFEQVAEGMLALKALPQDLREALMSVAATIAHTGMASFSEAATAAAGSRAVQAPGMDRIGRLASLVRGQRTSTRDVVDMSRRVTNNEMVQASDRAQRLDIQTSNVQAQQFADTAEGAAAKRLETTNDILRSLLLEMKDQKRERLEDGRINAARAGGFSEFFRSLIGASAGQEQYRDFLAYQQWLADNNLAR